MKRTEVAFIYDFDGTLAHGNIQEYNFIPALRMSSNEFWDEVKDIRENNNMENVLAYMYVMLENAKKRGISVKKSSFLDYGKNITFFPGVLDWFDRINIYGKFLGLNIKHYIVSSGIKEMIEGTEIKDKFDRIYACSFLFDKNDVARWPAVSVNYTNKTQFIYRINKGIYEVYDEHINDKMESDKKKIPFTNMIYFGDGLTDVPCMKLVKENGGTSIAVYENDDKKQLSEKLLKDERVNYIAKTDYSLNSNLENYVKVILEKISKENV